MGGENGAETRVKSKESQEKKAAPKHNTYTASGAAGLTAMEKIDWTPDNSFYQWWLTWTEEAEHSLAAMEGDTTKTKISFLHIWVNKQGMTLFMQWKNQGIIFSHEDYEALDVGNKDKKFPDDEIETYFTLTERHMTPRSSTLLAVEELYSTKQGSMSMQDFYSKLCRLAKDYNFPSQDTERRVMGLCSQKVKDKAKNLDGDITTEFLMNHARREDSSTVYYSLSQMNSTGHVNYMCYNHK